MLRPEKLLKQVGMRPECKELLCSAQPVIAKQLFLTRADTKILLEILHT